jgi:hypothetical protein
MPRLHIKSMPRSCCCGSRASSTHASGVVVSVFSWPVSPKLTSSALRDCARARALYLSLGFAHVLTGVGLRWQRAAAPR